MNEHSFIRSIHTNISSDVFVWKIADKYQGGVPDTYYSGPFGYMYIEYKYIQNIPKRSTTKIKVTLTELQRSWLRRAQSHNHLAASAVPGKCPADPGRSIASERPVRTTPCGQPSPGDWDDPAGDPN